MRAIAILLVLIFHIEEAFLPGGFIGVDVFFVVSGFIITKNIEHSIKENKFSFMDFYTKRIARLMPAVSVTVAVTLLVASQIYGIERLKEFSVAGFYSIVPVSNIYFWLQSGYFDTVSQGNPFLHTWSLGVEEQFYLFWPLLLFFMKPRLLALLGGLVVFGLVFSLTLADNHPSAAFFLTPARIFQFALGAGVAVLLTRYPALFAWDRHGALAAAGVGMLLVLSVVVKGNSSPYVLSAVAPALAASLVLCSMQGVAGRVLSAAPMRYVGLRAYSTYLVHWPVIVLVKMGLSDWPDASRIALMLVLTWVLAEGLYRLVETPVRVTRRDSERTHRFKLLSSFAIILCSGTLAVTILSSNPPEEDVEPFDYARADGSRLGYTVEELRQASRTRARDGRAVLGCQPGDRHTFADYEQGACLARSVRGRSVLVIADSFGAETVIMLETVLPPARIMSASWAGCIPFYPEPGGNRSQGCQDMNSFRYRFAGESPDVGAIVIAANWQWWLAPESAFEYLNSLGVPVVVFGPRPIFSEQVINIVNSAAFNDDLTPNLRVDLSARSAQLAEIIEGYENIRFVDVWSVLCPDTCLSNTTDGAAIYIDNAHLTPAAAVWLGRQIGGDLNALVAALDAG